MTLSFLQLARLRTIQSLFLQRSDYPDLATEIGIHRHEVVVLRRRVDRLGLQPNDRALLAGPSQLIPGRSSIGSCPDRHSAPLASSAGPAQVDLPKLPGRPTIPK